MDRSAVLKLISETNTQDSYGVWRKSTSARTVYCQVGSITRSEFYEAGRNGLNPEFMLTMFYPDYEGERICELDGQQYAIYRTYRARNDTIELYVIRKGGTNAAEEDEDADPEEPVVPEEPGNG